MNDYELHHILRNAGRQPEDSAPSGGAASLPPPDPAAEFDALGERLEAQAMHDRGEDSSDYGRSAARHTAAEHGIELAAEALRHMLNNTSSHYATVRASEAARKQFQAALDAIWEYHLA